MLADCNDKKIDLIITKSISRFGRNTVDILDVINKLRLLYVDVLFEVEKIQISETNKTFLLSILETVAQAESEARSQNIKCGIKHALETRTSKRYNLYLCFHSTYYIFFPLKGAHTYPKMHTPY
ncbi:recombinase family protein [Clostridium tagluense]|uniref:recombinase family protein n=1 Tax=Clostridium tagluense TaxID=360422 RepID=UPI001C6E6E0C|nr:recombinase family protein [Clostridium tagluense]WLC66133.1 recombinase family protein [Clostridium tagluense]